VAESTETVNKYKVSVIFLQS